MSKICAFLGNDYDVILGVKNPHIPNKLLKEKIKEQIINLIENEDVTTFFVGEIGGFEIDAYDSVIEVKQMYPHISIIQVISKITELHRTGRDFCGIVEYRRPCDDFIYPDKCAIGYKRLSIVYRNQFIIQHTNFIIAYNEYKGRAYNFCKQAQNKGITIIELSDKTI